MKKNPDYTVIYSDDDIVVLNKRSNLLIAQDRYDADAPRLDLLAEKEFGHLFAVHRIDKDTSGIIVYARNENAHQNLSVQFEKRLVEKTYHALVRGKPMWDSLHVDLPLLPDGDSRHRTVVNKRFGKPSVTDFKFLCSAGLFSWIEAKPKTGRTHQIRVHLAESGFPIVCDPLYSGNLKPVRLSDFKRNWNGDVLDEKPLLNRLALHAYKISFTHPSTQKKIAFIAPYQKDMDALRKQFAKIFGSDSIAVSESL